MLLDANHRHAEDGRGEATEQTAAHLGRCLRNRARRSQQLVNVINDPALEKAHTENPLLAFTPEQEVEIMRRHPADFPPGAQVRYSDSNYVLLGLILEKVTGKTTADVIESRILRPLGLTETSYPDAPRTPEPFPRGYAAAPNSVDLRDVTESNPAVANAAGAMISTPGDLGHWGKALADGALLSPKTQAQRLRTEPVSQIPGFRVGDDLAVDIAHLLFPGRFPQAAGKPVPATPMA